MFFNQPVTVASDAPGEYQNGIWQPGTTATRTEMASVQPANSNDLQHLPEGRRQARAFALYTRRPVRGADDNAGQQPERVKIAGEWYEVAYVEPWQNRVISHYKTIVVRMQEQS